MTLPSTRAKRSPISGHPLFAPDDGVHHLPHVFAKLAGGPLLGAEAARVDGLSRCAGKEILSAGAGRSLVRKKHARIARAK